MNQDLETNIPVNNNNEQQPEKGFEEGFEEESEKEFEEGFEESSKDSSEKDQGKNQTIKETNIQKGVLKEVVILLKQPTKSTKGSTIKESLRVARKKPVPPIPKPDPKPIQVLRTLSLNSNLDSEPEDNIKQVLMTTLKEVKITRLNLFYKDKKKLKAYLAQTRTYLVLNNYLLPENTYKVL
ncbi:hypothetical protein B7463_g12214, partial [Scytalidium lignicola]